MKFYGLFLIGVMQNIAYGTSYDTLFDQPKIGETWVTVQILYNLKDFDKSSSKKELKFSMPISSTIQEVLAEATNEFDRTNLPLTKKTLEISIKRFFTCGTTYLEKDTTLNDIASKTKAIPLLQAHITPSSATTAQ